MRAYLFLKNLSSGGEGQETGLSYIRSKAARKGDIKSQRMSDKQNEVPFLSRLWVKIMLVVILLVALLLFGFIVHLVFIREEQRFDNAIIDAIQSYKTSQWISFAAFITKFGSNIFLFPAYVLIAGYQFYRGRRTLAINIAILGLSSIALLHGLKALFRRSRPDTAVMEDISRYSFPSGHTMSAFIFCCIAGYLTWKTKLHVALKILIIFLLLILALLVGFSRIILGVHYPSDVAGSLALGISWVLLSVSLLNAINKRRSIRRSGY
jgi:undecaprenyl-diphosphatase